MRYTVVHNRRGLGPEVEPQSNGSVHGQFKVQSERQSRATRGGGGEDARVSRAIM